MAPNIDGKIGLDKFIVKCNGMVCLRGSLRTPKCLTLNKQRVCYDKYIKAKDKKIVEDEAYSLFRKAVWKRDTGLDKPIPKTKHWRKYCKLFKCLSPKEFTAMESIFHDNLFLNENLDVAHIITRSYDIREKYNPDNGVVIGRMFHRLLDGNRSPVDGKLITSDEREAWLRRAKNG